MNLIPLSPDVSATGQLEPSAMAAVAAAGFKSVVNNRPDFEGGPDQALSANLQIAAQAVGLQYAYLPVQGSQQSAEEVAQFAHLLATLPKPLLAFCRSGGRCGRLFQLASELGA
jgi:uncharacterized protein (TIGR01244 family)